MKIGQVVKDYGISVHSLYFYINNGLLVPPRRGSQYEFDQRTLEELALILELKQMEFPLKTIHRLLSLRRISNFCSREDQAERARIFLGHEERLRQKEAELTVARDRVRRKLADFDVLRQSNRTGVPVQMLKLLCCPHCRGELLLENVTMNQRYVFQGELSCSCGYSAAIREGILHTGNVNTSPYDKPDTTRELYRDLPSLTLSLFEQSYRWLERCISSTASHGKVWLEGYVNAWFFFHNHLSLLNSEDSLIVLDKFPETLAAYKEVIENQGPTCDILYLADCSMTPPLKREIIDCSMDFFATNEHNFYHQDLYLSQLRPYLKRHADLYGVYFFFSNGTKSMRKLLHNYPESAKHNSNAQWFFQELKKQFRIIETSDCGCSLDSGENLGLGFHVFGEELHLQPYYAQPL